MSLKCLEPVRIRHGDDYIYVPCGHCESCCYNKQSDWSTRLEFESKSYPKKSVLFVGLSYNDEHLPEYGSLCKRDIQLFMKRLRKHIFPRKCRFFAAGEYGEQKDRPHYHFILFGVTRADLKLYCDFYSKKVKGTVAFSRLWHDPKDNTPIGRITVQDIHPAHFGYVSKYVTKKYHGSDAQAYEEFFGVIPEFVQMSRNPGIGREECEVRIERLRRDGAIWIKPGKFKPLPRYFVNIVFPDQNDLDYLEWKQKRIDWALEAERRWMDEHPGLTHEQARELQRLQILRRLETMKRSKGYQNAISKETIFKKELERRAFERFNALFEGKTRKTDS